LCDFEEDCLDASDERGCSIPLHPRDLVTDRPALG
jgi:hypothetical protein